MSIRFLLLIFFLSINIQAATQPTWCVAKPSTEALKLQKIIDYCCNLIDCTNHQRSCSLSPNGLLAVASVAMNSYYQTAGKHSWNCDFENSGIITLSDPSYGDCRYEYNPGGTSNGSNFKSNYLIQALVTVAVVLLVI